MAWASPSRLLEGKLFAALPPSLVITTDASGQGWGAVLHPHRVSGVWSKEEALDHINTLELNAVLLALQNLESLVVGHSLLICSDYMTVVSFIIYQGGTHSLSLCRLALDLWEWCLRRRIFLHAAHIPGEEYIVADFLSRGKYLSYSVGSESCRFSDDLLYVFFPSGVRFVRVSSQFPAPEVLLSVPGCSGVENRRSVVSLDGSSTLRVFPFSLLLRILDKFAQDEADLLLVASFWPQRPWFPRLLRLLVGLPRMLPVLKDLVVQPISLIPHPKVESLHLSLWPLSGNKVRRQAFHKELRSSQLRPLDNPLEILSIPDWSLSGSGAPRSLAIPLLPL